MSNADAEAVIARGCKLLMSNDPNSEEELRKMLEEIIRNKYGPRKAQSIANLANTAIGQVSYKRVHSITLSDDDEIEDNSKKLKICENIKSNSNSPNNVVYHTESSNPEVDDELTMEILDDNVCIVCSRSVGPGHRNQIVECMDCHNLYHQNCATPPIDADVNDPRFAWYCHNCNKGSNKSSSSIPTTSSRNSSETINNAWTSGSSSSGNNSGSGSSSSKPSTKSSSGSSRSNQGSSYSNKQFGNKYNKLFKSVKR